jgi:TniQ
MHAFQCELPVVFRPHADEALSSWLTRIAGVYHLDLATLASECLGWKPDALAEIDLAPSATALEDLSRLTRADQSCRSQLMSRPMLVYFQWCTDGQTARILF